MRYYMNRLIEGYGASTDEYSDFGGWCGGSRARPEAIGHGSRATLKVHTGQRGGRLARLFARPRDDVRVIDADDLRSIMAHLKVGDVGRALGECLEVWGPLNL